MSAPVRTLWTNTSTAAIRTGSWRTALPVYRNPPAPCHRACPVDGSIPVWVQSLARSSQREAWLALVENNPFPAVTGRVCHHPCEVACNRRTLDQPVAIRCLEKYVGDMALERGWEFGSAPLSKAETVAIIGGGPAGLTAAYYLRRKGYAVTIFEAMPALGGVLRYGIPPYRLPKELLDDEIRRLLALGIDAITDAPVSGPVSFEALRERFSAIFVATGAGVPRRLAQLDYSKPWVTDSVEFLAQTNRGKRPECGRRVVVIGGGSAAIDVARTARRHGCSVLVLCLEKEAQMPAQREEVTEAKQEGIVIDDGSMLQSVVDRDTDGPYLRCARVRTGLRPGGELDVELIPGTSFMIEADTVVSAIGQDPDLTPYAALLQAEAGLIRVDRELRTSHPAIFAGGDVASTQRFVTVAFGFGKRAANAIDGYLRGKADDPACTATPSVAFDAINTHYHSTTARLPRRLVPAMKRAASFEDVEAGFPEAEAIAEAGRCFSCGNCTFCDNCLVYCPDMAIRKVAAGYSVNTDYCKGCGLCVAECPTGSIVMQQEG